MEQATNISSLGKYRLIASLGQGGMAKLYVALIAGLAGFQKLLVVKVLREDLLAGSDDAVKLFLNEARLAARLVHPNVVQTYEVGEIDGRYFLAMEYLDGQSYRAVQARAAPQGLPLGEELRVLVEVARGLEYLHELKSLSGQPLGIVHRDVSPQNVFVTYDGQVKLLDFGIAKVLDAGNLTQVGIIKGKIDYIAPEQLRGDAVDRRADVFSLGAMLWEAVTGQRFAGGRTVSTVTKVHARITGCERQVRTLAPHVPEELARIIDRAIAVDPDERWPTAAAFGEALERFIEATGEKPSAKSLAEHMTALFADDRKRMREVIERQVQVVSQLAALEHGSGENTGELPRLGTHQSRTMSNLWDMMGEGTSQGSLSRGIPGTAPLTSGHYPTTDERKKPQYRALAMVLISAAVGAGVTWLAPYHLRSDAMATAATAEPAATPIAEVQPVQPLPAVGAVPTTAPIESDSSSATVTRSTAVAPAEVAVRLEVRVSPHDAQITIDGAPVDTPFKGEFRRDGSFHHIEVAARGYRPFKQLVTFDRDRAIEVTLRRASTGPSREVSGADEVAGPIKPTSASEAEVRAQEPVLAPGVELKTRLRPSASAQIDTDDPYAGR